MKKFIFLICMIFNSIMLVNAATCQFVTGDGTKIGDEVKCEEETFNIIAIEEDTVTLLAKYNLGTNFKQTTEINEVSFANTCTWPYQPGPLEVDLEQYDGSAKEYTKQYNEYIKNIAKEDLISVDLPTLKDLKNIGCKINDDYTYSSDITCEGTEHSSWLINGQWWWLKSAFATEYARVFIVTDTGKLSYGGGCYFANGLRPIVKLSKKILEPKTITTKTDGNGIIEVIENSKPGESVSYKVEPKEGYKLKEVKIIDDQGNVTIINEENFIMPESNVTIEVVFEKEIVEEPEVENPNTISISILASLIFGIISFIIVKVYYPKMKWLNE